MAQLSGADHARIWRGLMRYWSNLREALGALSKHDLRDAVDATDAWVDNNQASFNNALPEPARSEMTSVQKSLMLCAVVLARVSMNLLRQVFGEVD